MRLPIRIILMNMTLSLLSSLFICLELLVYYYHTTLKDKVISNGLLVVYIIFTLFVNVIYYRKSSYVSRLGISAGDYALVSVISLLAPYVLFFGISIIAGLIKRLTNNNF